MSDRVLGFTVTLEGELRDDDAEVIRDAIEALRGVLRADPLVSDPGIWAARQQARQEYRKRLFDALED